MAKRLTLHPSIKRALRLPAEVNGAEVLRDWTRRTRKLCKPCWELHYCPYGPVVEDFPLLPPVRAEAKDHNERLRSGLRSGRLLDGRPLDAERRRIFRQMVADYKDEDFPEAVPKVLAEASCRVFGHLCPVFFVAEPLTETLTLRAHTRTISREVMLKVVRRDGQICQRCHEPVPDDEVEFDHVIPFSKGGRSTAENLRLVHRDCNRRKSDSLREVLHPMPIQPFLETRTKKRR
jgi:5-methylcytosine-specific restriction endonuclease McrA